jgi:branched-chain amino acid transport system ATP-binding protein
MNSSESPHGPVPAPGVSASTPGKEAGRGAGAAEPGADAPAGASAGPGAGAERGAGPEPGAGTPLLQLDSIDVFYGSVQALSEVSLEVHAGEVVAVLGGNASGKSTTLKSALGMVVPKSGSVHLDGEEVTGIQTPDLIEQGLASVPEGRRVFPEMTVRENLMLGAYVRRRERRSRELSREAEAQLERFPQLADRLEQLGGTLSGGEQQMLAMARALMRRPRLLCIDEPSMGLSPRYVDTVYEALFRLREEGLTLLMVEQNANRALELAHRAYILRGGAIAKSGAAAELRGDPEVKRAYLGG